MEATEQVAICDEKIENEELLTYTTNKIGGLPKFFNEKYFNLKQCNNCDAKMVLVTQLYCPFVESTYHRIVYIMACVNRSCWNKSDSWCAYRSQLQDFEYLRKLEEEKRAKESQEKQSFATSDNWGCGANEWAVDDENQEQMNFDYENYQSPTSPVQYNYAQTNSRHSSISSSFTPKTTLEECMDNLDISNSSDSDFAADQNNNALINETMKEAFSEWKKTINGLTRSPTITFDTNLPYFQPFYLNVLSKEQFQEDKNYKKETKKYNAVAAEVIDDAAYSKPEEYEKTNLKHGDKIFYKFRKSIDYCPYQAVRYSRKGSPLFITKHDDFKLDTVRCNYCNGKCVFEFQLMPALVNFLKPIESKYTSIEFGTVIVYTCENSCWSDSDIFRTEHVYVQADPDEKLFS